MTGRDPGGVTLRSRTHIRTSSGTVPARGEGTGSPSIQPSLGQPSCLVCCVAPEGPIRRSPIGRRRGARRRRDIGGERDVGAEELSPDESSLHGQPRRDDPPDDYAASGRDRTSDECTAGRRRCAGGAGVGLPNAGMIRVRREETGADLGLLCRLGLKVMASVDDGRVGYVVSFDVRVASGRRETISSASGSQCASPRASPARFRPVR
jgi:hypothetical protein